MASKYTGYQGFCPYAFRKAEALKPGENKDQRDNKFVAAGAKVVVGEDSRFSTTTSLATSGTKRSDYAAAHNARTNPLKEKDQRMPPQGKFIAQSSYQSNYPNYLQELLDLKGNSEEDFRRAFAKCDRDKSGYIEAREVKALLAEATGKPPAPRLVDTFMVFFDANHDGKVDWQEFVTALSKVEGHMEKSLKTRAPKSNAPKWMQETPTRVLSGFVPQSSAQRDASGSRAGSTQDLFAGTTKTTNHIPGYKGYISAANPSAAENSRASKNDRYIVETYNHNSPGYTGKSRGLGLGKMKTTNSTKDRLLEEMWAAKRAEGK